MTYLETNICHLSTSSPIHIRAGELRYGEGTIRVGNTLYVVDTPKLQSEILHFGGMDAVDKYTETFSNPNSRTTIVDFLNRIKYPYKSNIEKISKGIILLPSGNRFMQSGLGKHFVPGSSIKGAIKTAVLYHNLIQRIAEENFDFNAFVDGEIEAYLAIQYPHDFQRQRRERENSKRRFAGDLLEKAFQSLHPQEYPWISPWVDRSRFAEVITHPGSQGATLKTLEGGQIHLPLDKITTNLKKGEWIEINTIEEQDGAKAVATYTKIDKPPSVSIKQNPDRNKEPKGPFTDIFKAIKVKDAIIEQTISFEDILFTTLSGRQIVKKNVGDNTRFECFHGETTVEISIDHEILDNFKRAGATPPFSGVKSLISLCQNFAQEQWKVEKRFLEEYPGGRGINLDAIKKFYLDSNNEQSVTLRVGWGTGMLGTTVALLLDKTTTRRKLRNEVISSGRHNYPGQPAPKSRRFVLSGEQPAYPLDGLNLFELMERIVCQKYEIG